MSMYTEQQAKAILDKVLAYSKADECTATLTGGLDGNIRFALNNVSTSGIVSDADLAVQVAFGKRVGLATINSFDDESLRNVVLRAEELARLAPRNGIAGAGAPTIPFRVAAKQAMFEERLAARR